MMEPKAKEPMENLAKRTGGEFTMIDADGKAHKGGKGGGKTKPRKKRK